MRESNRIVAEVLGEISKKICPGITTLELDRKAEKIIRERGGEPAFLGYRGYPYTICASVNEEVVHGLPSKRKLKEGDIIGIDVGVRYQGYYGDAAITLPVGRISELAQRLLAVTQEALDRAVEQVQIGNRIYDISSAIQDHTERNGFSVVRDFVGHGIGTELHEAPQIPNFRLEDSSSRITVKPGMVLAIEPMVNVGLSDVEILEDGWTVVTKDRKLSAHYEYSVAATENGPYILNEL